jgi:hypothetical protein
MRQLKLVGIGGLVACTVLGVGYLWGSHGRWAAEERLSAVERRLLLSEARQEAYAGSLDLQKLNFGAAAGHFEAGRAAAEKARLSLDATGLHTQAEDAHAGATLLDEARAMSSRLDQAAASRAAQAAQALERAARAQP